MFGIDKDLIAIGTALDELEARIDRLGALTLRLAIGFSPTRAQLERIGACGPETAALLRTMGADGTMCRLLTVQGGE